MAVGTFVAGSASSQKNCRGYASIYRADSVPQSHNLIEHCATVLPLYASGADNQSSLVQSTTTSLWHQGVDAGYRGP
jgi:hypothetical protein